MTVTPSLLVSGMIAGDPRVARLLVLGAVNWTAKWYRADNRASGASRRMSVDALARQTEKLLLR